MEKANEREAAIGKQEKPRAAGKVHSPPRSWENMIMRERESGRVGRSGEKERERVELSDKENAKQKPWHAMENEKMRAKGSMHDFLAMGK